MIIGVSGSYVQDESGQWWWHEKEGHSRRLRLQVHICEYCGEEFVRRPGTNPRQEHCSRTCSAACKRRGAPFHKPMDIRGSKGTRWKGGRRVLKGYVFIWVGDDHPAFRGTQRKYMAEHRLVMEQMIGRPLLKTERVHHKNGVTIDNRPENLELWNNGHPSGQRLGEGKHCPTCTCGQPHQ